MSSLMEDVLIRVKAKDETGNAFSGLRGKISAMKVVGVAAATALGASMLSFSKTCVQSAMDAEQGWNAYNSALERAGMGSSTQLSQMKSQILDLASSLGRSTGDVRQAATDFMNYGVSAEEAMKGASAASAIAAAKNMDYASAENVVMSALKGRAGQLKSLGINVDDYKDKTTGAIDTTRLFSDITAKYGRNQQKYSKSAAAQQQRLTNSINAFKTSVGQALLPIIEAVTPVLTQFAKALAKNPGLAQFTAGIVGLVAAMGLLSGPIATLQALSDAGVFAKIGSGFAKIGSSAVSGLKTAKDTVTAFKSALTNPQLYNTWKKFNSIGVSTKSDVQIDYSPVQKAENALNNLKTKATEAGSKLAGMFKSGASAAINGLKTALSTLATKLSEIGSKALGAGSKLAGMVKSGASSAINGLKTALSTLATKLSEIGSKATEVGSKLAGIVKSGASSAINGLKTALTGLKNTLISVKDASVQAGSKLLAAGKSALTAGYSAAKSAVMWIAEKTQKLLSAAASYTLSAAQTVLNVVMSLNPVTIIVIALIALVAILVLAYTKVGWFRDMVNNFAKTLMSIGQQIWSFFASIPSKIISFLQQAYAAIIGVGGQIINFYITFYSTIITTIITILTTIITTIISFVASVYTAAVSFGRNIYNGIVNIVSTIVARARSTFSNIVSAIIGFAGSVYSAAATVGRNIYNGVVNFITGILSGISNVFSQIVSTITGFASSVYNAAVQIGQNIWNGIVNGLGALGQFASSLVGMVTGGAGGSEAGLTYEGGAGGLEAGLTYQGNKKTHNLSGVRTGNPSYTSNSKNTKQNTFNRNITNQQHTYVLKEGAMSVDARNMTLNEAKQLVTAVFEDIPKKTGVR